MPRIPKPKKPFWNEISKVLPKDKQKITVYDEGLGKELYRVFYLSFWQKHNRILNCSHFCKKWRPRE